MKPLGPAKLSPGIAGDRGEQRRQRAAVLVLGDQPVAEHHDLLGDPVAAVELEVGRGVAGVRGGRQHDRTGGEQTALQLGGEQQVGELGLAVGTPRPVALALPVEIVEVDLAEAVGARGDGDDAAGDVLQQQVGEREVAEMVGAELQLEAVRRPDQRRDHHAGVVDQQVDLAVPAGRERTHRLQACRDPVRGPRWCRASSPAAVSALVGVADGEHDARALGGERLGGGAADAAVGPGDDRCAPVCPGCLRCSTRK